MFSSFPGPASLGRGVVVNPGQNVPSAFTNAPVFTIDSDTLSSPSNTVQQMHKLWSQRQPFVVVLDLPDAQLRSMAQAVECASPWELGPTFTFELERLHFLVWANNWDCRKPEPIWWWARKAIAVGATLATNADVIVNETETFIDGGPLHPVNDLATIHRTSVENGQLRFLQDKPLQAELAEDQTSAVTHMGGAARIIAPAGSGKTRVLTERLRNVLDNWNVQPSSVCAVAYNVRAASELTERTEGVKANIRTLNSLGLAIVSGSGGFPKSSLESSPRRMIDEREVRNILANLISTPRRSNTDPFAVWLEALSAARLGLRSPDSVENDFPDATDFADVFEKYRAILDKNRLLDFDEQIYRAVEILLLDAQARQASQRRCRMLLVDEFQDLTPAHMLLVRLLSSPSLDIFGVGDDDQVIYGYAGADPEYLVNFETLFPGATSHPLKINYRCPPSVVEAASNLLTRNFPRVEKEIYSSPQRTRAVEEMRIEQLSSSNLAVRAAELTQEWINSEVPPSEIAILSRVNVTLLPAQILLSQLGIGCTRPVNTELLNRTGIKTALAYLRMGNEPERITREDIMLTVRRPSRKIARNVVEMMTKRRTTSTYELTKLANALSGSDAERVLSFVDDIEAVERAVSKGTASALSTVRKQIGLANVMETLDSSRSEVDRSPHGDDLLSLEAVAHLHTEVATFESWLKEQLSQPAVKDGVELSTVHRVKGREWNNVIVFGADQGLMPHRLSTSIAEERRIFHVAITRCRTKSVILARSDSPSPFLQELDQPGKPEIQTPKPSKVETKEAKTAVKRPTIVPTLGLVLSTGGMEGEVVEITQEGVVISPGGRARLTIKYGEDVRHLGTVGALEHPPRITDPQLLETLLTALREWRMSVAKETGIPAFTVLHDTHLSSIAQAGPTTLEELSKCKGIGPAKLDKWGDDILAAIDKVLQSSAL